MTMSRRCGRPISVGFSVFVLVLGGCGGRVARPVEVVRPFDDSLTCVHIVQELQSNSDRIADLRGEVKAQNDNNVGLLIVSPLFLNVNDSEDKEIEALVARNQRLVVLAEEDSCLVVSVQSPDVTSDEDQ